MPPTPRETPPKKNDDGTAPAPPSDAVVQNFGTTDPAGSELLAAVEKAAALRSAGQA